jgi:hypothetical protein
MGVLSSAQFAAYARGQIRTADVILTDHTAQGPMCSCGRVVPCSVALAVTRRRIHFIDALARTVARPVVGRARVAPLTRHGRTVV